MFALSTRNGLGKRAGLVPGIALGLSLLFIMISLLILNFKPHWIFMEGNQIQNHVQNLEEYARGEDVVVLANIIKDGINLLAVNQPVPSNWLEAHLMQFERFEHKVNTYTKQAFPEQYSYDFQAYYAGIMQGLQEFYEAIGRHAYFPDDFVPPEQIQNIQPLEKQNIGDPCVPGEQNNEDPCAPIFAIQNSIGDSHRPAEEGYVKMPSGSPRLRSHFPNNSVPLEQIQNIQPWGKQNIEDPFVPGDQNIEDPYASRFARQNSIGDSRTPAQQGYVHMSSPGRRW